MPQRYVIKIVLTIECYIANLHKYLIYNILYSYFFKQNSVIVTLSITIVTNKSTYSDIFSE